MKAHVRNGRLVLDEPTDLPEGAVVSLPPADWDAMDEADRRRLDDALAASEEDFAADDVVSAEALLATLRQAGLLAIDNIDQPASKACRKLESSSSGHDG